MGAVCCVGVPNVFVLSSTELEDPEMKNVDMRQSAPIIPAKSHVPFSSTSVVCFTPMNWLLKPAMLPARPPPFGFWTSTIKPRTKEAIMINTTNKITISTVF